MQEYFLAACSLADIVRRFRRNNSDWGALAQKAAVQAYKEQAVAPAAERSTTTMGDALRAAARKREETDEDE